MENYNIISIKKSFNEHAVQDYTSWNGRNLQDKSVIKSGNIEREEKLLTKIAEKTHRNEIVMKIKTY